jgi:hypothetical protein
MDLHNGGIDHRIFHIRFVRADLEEPDENISFQPLPIALEGRVPVSEKGRKIAPGATRSRDPQHRFDEAAVVAPTAPRVRRLAQTMRFHLCPLGVRQNKAIHPKCESQSAQYGNPESQQALERAGRRAAPRWPSGSRPPLPSDPFASATSVPLKRPRRSKAKPARRGNRGTCCSAVLPSGDAMFAPGGDGRLILPSIKTGLRRGNPIRHTGTTMAYCVGNVRDAGNDCIFAHAPCSVSGTQRDFEWIVSLFDD